MFFSSQLLSQEQFLKLSESSVTPVVVQGKQKVRAGKSTGMNSINAPVCQAEHTGSHSLIIMPLFTLTHQHKIQGAHCRAHPTSAPLWGALGTPTKPSLKTHLPEAEAHSPGAALIIWNNPCSSQQGLGGVQIPLVSRHNVVGRALLLSFFLIKGPY